MSTINNFIRYLMYSGADGGLPSALFVTYQTQGSYDIHSFDSAFPAVAESIHQSAGSERPPVPGGT